MSKPITIEKLLLMSVHDRHQLYKNALIAKAKGNPGADELLRMIEESGLPYSESGGLSEDNPIVLAIYDIVHSKQGEEAMKNAIDAGLPPMAGVDPMIARELGVDYGGHNQATATAGDFVAKRMRSLGYTDTGKSMSLPDYCVAKTARLFTS